MSTLVRAASVLVMVALPTCLFGCSQPIDYAQWQVAEDGQTIIAFQARRQVGAWVDVHFTERPRSVIGHSRRDWETGLEWWEPDDGPLVVEDWQGTVTRFEGAR